MKHIPGFTLLATAILSLGFACSPVLARDNAKPKQELQYPDTTRVAPKLDLTSEKDQKNLQAALEALNAGDSAKAQTLLQALHDSSKSKYAQAMALRGLAVIKYNAADYKAAIGLLQQALANGVLPNDDYFAVEYILAAAQQADGQYQASLDTIAKWRAEGKKVTADSYALEGNDQYRLGKFPDAIAAVKKAQSLTDKPNPQWNQILMAAYSESGQTDQVVQLAQQDLAAHPGDPTRLNNAIVALTQAQKYPEAISLMESARSKGELTTEENYVLLTKLYFNKAQTSDNPVPDATKAMATLKEGMDKGVVTSSADNYVLLGKAEYLAGKIDDASKDYNKALPLAKDGEPALQIANILLSESKYGQAKAMIQQSISKGVQHKGIAYLVLAESERGLKNKSAQIAALKLAAQEPETAERAKANLKKLGVKN
ncbi:MAG: tetratricopeptide repeat protein [Rhodanobacter sp.]|jgi:tetratricopeptide (TPR) repeat protein